MPFNATTCPVGFLSHLPSLANGTNGTDFEHEWFAPTRNHTTFEFGQVVINMFFCLPCLQELINIFYKFHYSLKRFICHSITSNDCKNFKIIDKKQSF